MTFSLRRNDVIFRKKELKRLIASKLGTKWQIAHIFFHMWNLDITHIYVHNHTHTYKTT